MTTVPRTWVRFPPRNFFRRCHLPSFIQLTTKRFIGTFQLQLLLFIIVYGLSSLIKKFFGFFHPRKLNFERVVHLNDRHPTNFIILYHVQVKTNLYLAKNTSKVFDLDNWSPFQMKELNESVEKIFQMEEVLSVNNTKDYLINLWGPWLLSKLKIKRIRSFVFENHFLPKQISFKRCRNASNS